MMTTQESNSGLHDAVNDRKVCQECHQVISLYQCPRCSLRTCSLACCKAHKIRVKCNGKRDRTQYSRLEDMNTATLQSDFHFLEDVLKNVDGSKRLLKQVGGRTSHRAAGSAANDTTNNNPLIELIKKKQAGEVSEDDDDGDGIEEHLQQDEKLQNNHQYHQRGNNNNNNNNKRPRHSGPPLPPKWRKLIQQAQDRQITLLLMPSGMERHKNNTSFVNTKTGIIHWKLEFILYSSDVNHHEECTTSNSLTKSLPKVSEEVNVWEEYCKLFQINNPDAHHLLIKNLPCPSHQPTFREIRLLKTLREILKDATVIEYPTLYVVPSSRLKEFPQAIRLEGDDSSSQSTSSSSSSSSDEDDNSKTAT